MDEWPLVELSDKKIRGLTLLYRAACDSMDRGHRLLADIRLREYFGAVENLIDHSIFNRLDHTKKKPPRRAA